MLLLTTDSYNQIVRQGIETYPAECCGFLLGKENNGQHIISKVIRCENKAETKNKAFLISAHDYMSAEKIADAKGLVLSGVYHSHPDVDAIPSETDAEYALPNLSYVIIAVFKHKVSSARSWRLNEQLFFEEEKIITDQNTIVKNNSSYGNHYHSHTSS